MNNPMSQMLNGGMNPMAMISQLQAQFAGQNPQQIVQGMVQSGRVTQEQVNQAVQMAQSFMGNNGMK